MGAQDLSRARLSRLALLLAVAALVAGVPNLDLIARLRVTGGFLLLSGLGFLASEVEPRWSVRWAGALAIVFDLSAHALVVLTMSAAGRPFLLLLALPVLIWGVIRGLSGGMAAALGAMSVALLVGWNGRMMPGLETIAAVLAFLFLGLCSGALGRRIQQAEHAHRVTSRELLETKLDAESIVACLSNGLLCLDPRGRIRRLNASAERLLLAGGDLSIGMELSALEERPGIAALGAHLRSCLGLGFDTTREFETEEWGGGFPLEAATAPLRGPDHAPRGLIVMLADLTERRARESERKRSEKLALIGQLSAGLAHEIRNSLKPITGSIELLRDEGWGKKAEGSREVRLTDIVLSEADRLEGFLSEFLAFARDKTLTVEPAALERVVVEEGASLTALLRGRLEREPLALGDATIRVDRGALGQVLRNLALNAAEASESAPIKLSATVEGQDACILLTDSGPGIPAKVLERVFEPFFTTKTRGTGLGLAIARDLVERMGGHLSLVPGPESGTTAIVRLPLAEPEARAA